MKSVVESKPRKKKPRDNTVPAANKKPRGKESAAKKSNQLPINFVELSVAEENTKMEQEKTRRCEINLAAKKLDVQKELSEKEMMMKAQLVGDREKMKHEKDMKKLKIKLLEKEEEIRRARGQHSTGYGGVMDHSSNMDAYGATPYLPVDLTNGAGSLSAFSASTSTSIPSNFSGPINLDNY